MDNYKISIITPSLNQSEYIKDTIESVLNQNYKNFEHIIIDGGSTDNTIEILKSYKHLTWISEKDTGSADAINKGFKLAKGEIIAWLNSDDYYDSGTFNKINELFYVNPETEIIIGNLTYINENKDVILRDKTTNFDLNYILNYSADSIRQPCSFFKKSLLDKIGFLNTKYRYVFDFELFIRILKVTIPLFVNLNFAFYREYSNTLTRKGLRKQAIEIFKVSRSHNGKLFSKQTKRILLKLIFPNIFVVK